MRKWTKTACLLFCAAASVYSDQAIGAKPGRPAKTPDKSQSSDVKVLEDNVDPFATEPTTAPTTEPSALNVPSGPVAPLQMNADGTFSLNIVSGADLVEQLRVIGFQAQKSILPSKEVHAALPALDLYNVTVNEALDALLHTNGFVWQEKGNFIYVYSAKEAAEMEKANRVMNTEVFKLYYTPAANALGMIKPVLSPEAQATSTTPAISGIESGAKDVGGNSHATDDMLVITDYPENLDQVRKIIKEIDRRPQQILIEATILRASLTEENELGVDFNVIGGADFSTIVSNTVGQITGAGAGSFSTNASSVGTGNSFSGPIQGGLKVGVVTNNVSVFVAALEGVTDTTVLANPKVLALNKQKGEVIVGRKDGYLTTTVTESAQTQTVEFLDTGTRLIFRPFIGDDGYIRMEIHPEDSSGGLTSANLPFKITTEVTSNVMVKDGHTIVIGGLFRESTDTSRSQIPVLGNLPFAGVLFRQQRDHTQREEVIILLTPHIVKDDAAYSALSEQQLALGEKMRVGVRRGMMFWGRERLAQMNYECAVQEMSKSKPDRKKAIWFLDAATGLNPMFVEAINMRQELTGQELTETGGSTARSFVQRAILADRYPDTVPSASAEDMLCDPATQPAMAETPTSQPALADALSSMSPTGGPGNEMVVVDVDSYQTPTTEPAMMVDATTQPVHSATAEGLGLGNIFAMMNRMLGIEQPAVSQTGDENAMEMTVTELPLEELPADSSGNK